MRPVPGARWRGGADRTDVRGHGPLPCRASPAAPRRTEVLRRATATRAEPALTRRPCFMGAQVGGRGGDPSSRFSPAGGGATVAHSGATRPGDTTGAPPALLLTLRLYRERMRASGQRQTAGLHPATSRDHAAPSRDLQPRRPIRPPITQRCVPGAARNTRPPGAARRNAWHLQRRSPPIRHGTATTPRSSPPGNMTSTDQRAGRCNPAPDTRHTSLRCSTPDDAAHLGTCSGLGAPSTVRNRAAIGAPARHLAISDAFGG